ncbi:MAG: enoyl-CoA hydratase/isomerase family protein [Nitratireductor sp.]|nr:enoyl-CoA hydratase/isomerase family protein [Nitratireductor sp.]
MLQFVEFEEDDGVAIITLNRPEKLNALNRQMATEINAVFREFFDSKSLRVAVYKARGRSFSGGADVVDMRAAFNEAPADAQGEAVKNFTIDFEEVEFCEKPIIAAIQGQCVGFGMTSSLACDIRIAANDAKFCLPEVKLGIASIHGNLRMVKMAGLARAMDLLLTGEMRSAQWALDAGVVNELVPMDALHDTAMAYARAIAAMDPAVIYATRRIGYMSQYSSFSDIVTAGMALRVRSKIDVDYVEAIAGGSRSAGGGARS